MVDVSGKQPTARAATAEALIELSAEAFAAVAEGQAPKGDVLATARIAGIMAAKKTPELIPLCHRSRSPRPRSPSKCSKTRTPSA